MVDELNAPDVVLVHGWAGSFESTWQRPGIDLLIEEGGRRVIGVDLLGHGTAPKPHAPEAYSDLTVRVREAITDPPVDAIGFSLGALTLLQLALATPTLFRRLVLAGIGSNVLASAPGTSSAERLEQYGVARQFERYASLADNDPQALSAVLERPIGAPITESALRALEIPVLVIIGDDDFLGPADEFVQHLPDGQLVVLSRTDHFATVERFEFIEHSLRFLGIDP